MEQIKNRAWEDTAVMLGHSKNRKELKAVYIIEDPDKILDIF